MVLDFEYGINTGNRFLQFVDHDEDPEDFIATQTQPEEKPKKSTKETKPTTSTTSKKTTTTIAGTNVSGNTTRTNKENLTGKSTSTDQRRQQTNVLGDNNNQQTRGDSARGGSRGFSRRGGGGGSGQDRPPYEGGNRGGGGGQQRTQRFNKFEGQQQPSNEASGFEQSGDAWGNETGNDNQGFGGFRGRGRGRGNYEGGRGGGRGRGNYEGGRGGGRGRGRGGRGNFNNRNVEEGSQQQPTQEGSGWQQSAESNFDNTRPQTAGTGTQELDADAPAQERSFEPGNRRGGRGQFRGRTFHNNRNYGSDRPNQYEREGDSEEYRQNRRQHDRQPRTNLSGVKPIEKKDGEGAHNWGSQTENPEENPVIDETVDPTGQGAPSQKDWAQQVDEAEKQMTLDEYKKQVEAKKRAQQEKVPQFNRRVAGEGEDPKTWQKFEQEYRKKNEGEESDEEELEEGEGSEANESGEENDDEQVSGKKKIITIPLRFKPIEIPRGGPAGSRGGPRRGGNNGGRYRDRPNRDDQTRSKSPSQQQSSYYQQTGEYQSDEQQQQQQQQQPQQQQQSRPYRGGSGRGSGRGEYRRSYGNSARGSRGSYNRSSADPNTPDFDNTVDFPTLPKQ